MPQPRIILFILALLLLSCTDDFDNTDSYESQLVVEGWIDDGGFPVVILTRTLPVSTQKQDIEKLKDYIIRWAKVTVSNGKDSVILTGKIDNGYFPPYIYTTSKMRGSAGERYSLTVEYKDFRACATTTIPSPPPHCSFNVLPCTDSDTLYQIKAKFTDNSEEKNYYQFFTRTGTETRQYMAAYLGSIDDDILDGETDFSIYRHHQLRRKNKYTPYFTINDTVSIKFAQVDEASFQIWDSYIKMLSLSGNLFLSTSSNITSNIVGGYGYWCGYGSIEQHIILQDSIKAKENFSFNDIAKNNYPAGL